MLRQTDQPEKARKRRRIRWPLLLLAVPVALSAWAVVGLQVNVGGFSFTTGWSSPYPPVPNPFKPLLAGDNSGPLFANLGQGRTIHSWIATVRIGGAVFHANYYWLKGPPLP